MPNLPNFSEVGVVLTGESDHQNLPDSTMNDSLDEALSIHSGFKNDTVSNDENHYSRSVSGSGNSLYKTHGRRAYYQRGRDRRNANGYHTFYAFDMRGIINEVVKGTKIYLDAHPNVRKQRIAAKYNVSDNNVLFKKDANTNIQTYVAILDDFDSENLTVFIKMESHDKDNYKCVNIPPNSSIENILYILDFSKKLRLFHEGKRLLDGFLCIQGVQSGSEINVCFVKTESFKCLYRVSPKCLHMYHIDCNTTDSILELKQQIRQTIRGVSKVNQPIPDNILFSDMWLTSGKRVYNDTEYIGFLIPSDDCSDDSDIDSSNACDFVIHFHPCNSIPVYVSYKIGEARMSSVETVIISRDTSSSNLREHISKLLQCSPNGIKMIANGKKLPEIDTLSGFAEFKPQCIIYASVRREITVNVHIDHNVIPISVFKLDPVISLKSKLANQLKTPQTKIALRFEDKEPNYSHRIEQINIKDNSVVFAQVFKDRVVIHIRKRREPILSFFVDNRNKIYIRDLKNMYRHTIKLNKHLDVQLHKFNSTIKLDDHLSLSDVELSDQDTLFATEQSENNRTGTVIKVFQPLETGQAVIKFGVICNCRIFYGPECEDNNLEVDGSVQAYVLPTACQGIRQAHSYELEQTEIHPIEEIAIKHQTVVQCITEILQQKTITSRQCSELHHTTIVYDDNLRRIVDPPGVVSDRDLAHLAKLLPGNDWQFFLRSIDIPNAIVCKYTESYPRNVTEAIYQCLNSWKMSKGKDALKKTIQSSLHEHEMRLISDTLFGFDTI